MSTEVMLSSASIVHEAIGQPEPMVGWVPARPTIGAGPLLLAESVAISGEALLIGLLVLLALAILGVAAIAGLVYLGAHLTARVAPPGRRAPSPCSSADDTMAAVAHDPTGPRRRTPRSRSRPLPVWLWVVCTLTSVGLVVALPGVWYLGPLAAPVLGVAASRFPIRTGR